jgi:hypothetical protein
MPRSPTPGVAADRAGAVPLVGRRVITEVLGDRIL